MAWARHLSTDFRLASSYANLKRGTGWPSVMQLYAAAINPYLASLEFKKKLANASPDVSAEVTKRLIAAGYDSVVLPLSDGSAEVMVFDPTQVKSVTGNTGAFNPEDPDIRYSFSPSQAQATNEVWDRLGLAPERKKSLTEYVRSLLETNFGGGTRSGWAWGGRMEWGVIREERSA